MNPDYTILAQTLKALAHPVRLEILDMLRGGEICVCHIEAALGKRQAYISQQLQVLRESGLVETRKVGLSVYYRLADPNVAELLAVVCGQVRRIEPLIDCSCPACRTEGVPYVNR
jgi:ArsR family transcriptional regulator